MCGVETVPPSRNPASILPPQHKFGRNITGVRIYLQHTAKPLEVLPRVCASTVF